MSRGNFIRAPKLRALVGGLGLALLLPLCAQAQLEFLNGWSLPGASDFVPLPDSSIYVARFCEVKRFSREGSLLASHPLGNFFFCRGFSANGLAMASLN